MVVLPANSELRREGNKILANGVAIDYRAGRDSP